MSAFFLEAGFLGIMLFGWGRVGPRAHFFIKIYLNTGLRSLPLRLVWELFPVS
ncbi:hypothetical protein EDM35_16095 [Staphylococcus aureus]|nr:hypothetical protein EDM47_16095 [Staphylococcus aureus]RNB22158.1 hypothetical protein EDM35_16095 [Staphylococcus aureus]